MGDDKLKLIAHELLMSLRKHGYPADLRALPCKRCCSRPRRCHRDGQSDLSLSNLRITRGPKLGHEWAIAQNAADNKKTKDR